MAVDGKTCINPMAPSSLTAFGSLLLSAIITEGTIAFISSSIEDGPPSFIRRAVSLSDPIPCGVGPRSGGGPDTSPPIAYSEEFRIIVLFLSLIMSAYLCAAKACSANSTMFSGVFCGPSSKYRSISARPPVSLKASIEVGEVIDF